MCTCSGASKQNIHFSVWTSFTPSCRAIAGGLRRIRGVRIGDHRNRVRSANMSAVESALRTSPRALGLPLTGADGCNRHAQREGGGESLPERPRNCAERPLDTEALKRYPAVRYLRRYLYLTTDVNARALDRPDVRADGDARAYDRPSRRRTRFFSWHR